MGTSVTRMGQFQVTMEEKDPSIIPVIAVAIGRITTRKTRANTQASLTVIAVITDGRSSSNEMPVVTQKPSENILDVI